VTCPVCSKEPSLHSLPEARSYLERIANDFEVVRRIVVPQHWTPMRKVGKWSG